MQNAINPDFESVDSQGLYSVFCLSLVGPVTFFLRIYYVWTWYQHGLAAALLLFSYTALTSFFFFFFSEDVFTLVILIAGVISGALLYIKDDFEAVKDSSFLQVQAFNCYGKAFSWSGDITWFWFLSRVRRVQGNRTISFSLTYGWEGIRVEEENELYLILFVKFFIAAKRKKM